MKSLKLYISLAIIFIIVYIIALTNKPKPVDWKESFLDKEKTPFGTYILYNQLSDIFPQAHIVAHRKPIYSVLTEDSVINSSYIIVANVVDVTKADYHQLIKYISMGNDVFISAANFGGTLHKLLKIETNSSYNLKLATDTVHFLNPNLNPHHNYIFDKNTDINYFSKFDTLKATVISENKGHLASLIRYKFGKGSLLLAVNPLLFTNYSLLKPDGKDYAAIALNHIKNTKNIVWDEYYTQGNLNDEDDSPMRVFLSKPYLQWAYYIALISLLVYVIFGVKRNQRVIPVILPLENKTLEFVNVVGQVYYEKRNNAIIAQKKIVYFLSRLREEYNLKTNQVDEEFAKKLISKFNLDTQLANELTNLINYISGYGEVTDAVLIKLNKLIEEFYLKASK